MRESRGDGLRYRLNIILHLGLSLGVSLGISLECTLKMCKCNLLKSLGGEALCSSFSGSQATNTLEAGRGTRGTLTLMCTPLCKHIRSLLLQSGALALPPDCETSEG